jgi:hypothetical protein
MKRRLVWLLMGVLALAAAGMAVACYLSSPDPINQSACERIQPGMTLDDVEKVIGKRWSGTLLSHEYPVPNERLDITMVAFAHYWERRHGLLVINFEPQGTLEHPYAGRVIWTMWVETTPTDSWLADLLDRLASPLRLKLGV